MRINCGTSKFFSTPTSSITKAIILFFIFFATWNLQAHAAESLKILAFGDSITAGYKLDPKLAFPSQLEEILRQKKIPATVINAGISGDTSLQGLQRVNWVMSHHHDIDLVLLELGANDGLRGLPIAQMEESLTKLIDEFKKRGVKEIVLFGMRTTKNQTTEYQRKFQASFPKIAQQKKILYLPFFLEKIAFNPQLTLEDLIHPNALGHRKLAEEIDRFLESQGVLKAFRH